MKKAFLTVTTAAAVLSCTSTGKLMSLRENPVAPEIMLPAEGFRQDLDDLDDVLSDTIRIRRLDGKDLILMNAVKDEDGEMVAHDRIKAAVVTARFRNVAEREGKVDITFDITVPGSMTDTDWMVKFRPVLETPEGNRELEYLQITGAKYRKKQLKGYERYNKFLESIITDPDGFLNRHQFEVFLRRNMPGVYKYRNDSTAVSEEQFVSEFGVGWEEAVRHYTQDYLVRRNKKRVSMKEKMRRKYIKMPIDTSGMRIDTVITAGSGDITYRYTQTLQVSSRMKKVSVSLMGDVYQEDKVVFSTPRSKPLDFYVSSLSSLADDSPRYIESIIHRSVEANTACYIDFAPGSSEIVPSREGNDKEIQRIKNNLHDLMSDDSFLLDSIVITASCSPEGTFRSNVHLASARAEAVKNYFDKYVADVSDSLERPYGDGKIRFITASVPENWTMLDKLVERESALTDMDKEGYRILSRQEDPDTRELYLQQKSCYPHIRSILYPRLRIVSFDFFLHRKGMIKDTVHTTVPDSVYAKGIEAIKERDYQTAIKLLRPYKDYNTAVAYSAAGYNASALDILEKQKKADKVLYMMAVIYSRTGKKQQAIQCYIDACKINGALISRGNMDPEISTLVREYSLQDILFNNI